MDGNQKFYCAFVRTDNRSVSLCQCQTREEAEKMMQNMMARDTRYNQFNLRVMTKSEIGQEFGSDWVRIHAFYS